MRYGSTGFTLVELAIVLVVMGLVGTIFYGVITGFIYKEKDDSALQVLDTVHEEMVGYAVKNRYLPDPTPGTDLLPEGLARRKDPWGGDTHFWPAVELAAKASITAERETSLIVEVYDNAGDFVSGTSPKRTIPNMAYVIASLGPNMSRQVFLDQPVGAYQNVIRILEPGGPLGSGVEYDDIVRYVTLNELKAKVTAVR